MRAITQKAIKSNDENFLKAVVTSNIKELKKCITKGANPNVTNGQRDAAIHIAAEKGDISLGKILLELPDLDINLLSGDGNTALAMACLIENRKFAHLLLLKNANPNKPNSFSQTPMHIAAQTNQISLILNLINFGGKVNVVDAFGKTPLSISLTDQPNIKIAELLLRNGAEIHPETGKYLSIFLELVLNCDSDFKIELLELLLENGANVNHINRITRRNCLHIVGITGYTPAAKVLLENGANLAAVDRSNRTPVDVAREHRNQEVLNVFLKWLQPKRTSEDSL